MKLIISFLFVSLNCFASSDLTGMWILKSGEASYSASHTFKTVVGISKNLKGKGSCDIKSCEFLIASTVKDFDSENSNRDLHMQKVTRAPEFPLVSVRVKFENKITANQVNATYEITFAGKTQSFSAKEFKANLNHKDLKIDGDIIIQLTKFEIEPPSLLGVMIKNEIPIHFFLNFEKG